jgi:hypothetical protein
VTVLRPEGHNTRATEGLREPRELTRSAGKAANAERRETEVVPQAAKLTLDCHATAVEVAVPLREPSSCLAFTHS